MAAEMQIFTVMIEAFTFTQNSSDTAELELCVTEENLLAVISQLQELGLDISLDEINDQASPARIGDDN